MTARRIAESGGHEPVEFTFDGRRYEGRHGDTLASALLANGVDIVARSFKYHRPRGIWGAWTEEPNAFFDVTVDGRHQPNARATTTVLEPGLSVVSVNASPSAENDRAGVLDRFWRFLPAGFYYKTFLWPDWRHYEPRIRAMAGLGRLDPDTQPGADCPQRNAHCDTLVIGGGPAGLAAARAAMQGGATIMLVDDRPEPGGTLLHREATIDGRPGAEWARATAEELAQGGARVLADATAYGLYDHRLVCVWQQRANAPGILWRIRAGRIVIAAGAIERPLVFEDNDRPGVMSADAALYYLRRHQVRVGERVVIATNNDGAYPVADALAEAGASVTIADLRAEVSMRPNEAVRLLRGTAVEAVHGKTRVEAVTAGGTRLAADRLLVSGGMTPSVHLFCQGGGKLRYREDIASFVPGDPVPGVDVAGAANGAFGLSEALGEGYRAGGGSGEAPRAPDAAAGLNIVAAWPDPAKASRAWVDFQNDVTVKDVALAARENFRSVEHLKRYTTLGMATDQGKTSNMNGLAAMAAATGRAIPDVGTTTYRPPFVPVPMTVVAGRRRGELFSPLRRLVLEDVHRSAGAIFRDYGGWLRPASFGGEAPETRMLHEARQARTSLGLFDGSPLGKIEVMGPDAAALMDFNSYNMLSTLKSGRFRYGFMLAETGVVYDDGVVARLGEDHFLVSCSSGHVAGVHLRLEEWRQDRFDPARVVIHNSTAQWATLTATGLASRDLVAALDLGVNLDDDALAHMAFADGAFEGKPARVARVSFTGDRSYEISVPATKAPALWARMRKEGRRLDAVLLGTEALMILRAEKGYIVAGKDTDGTTLPMDLGMSGPRGRRRDEFVGKRSLFTEEAERGDRANLVGLEVEGERPLATGAHAVKTVQGRRRSLGFVTSSYFSPTLGRPIALGLIENGRARTGETVEIYHLGAARQARIAAPCAFDPEGARLNA